tara:strand:+ start:342 stop:881 length:540 start_codon:yes stop_codon:yes gene_type:complete
MKIKVRRLKEIIEEELGLFKKLHEGYNYKRDEDEYDVDTEDVEELGDDAHACVAEQTDIILGDLKKVLEKWEEAEYDSDEERWQEYAKDVQGLVDQYEGGEEPEGHTEEECEEAHPDQTHEEWEAEQKEEEAEDKPKKKKEKSEGKSKKASSSKNFPYESKKLEQAIYQKLITALGGEE